MKAFVVDTNVPIVANGCSSQADEQCRLTCIGRLEYLMEEGIVAIDNRDAILKEYIDNFSPVGGHDVGDRFFVHIINHQYGETRVKRIPVTPIDDDQRGFNELPENSFDRSDRKFLAVAVVLGAVVLNATDSDWQEHGELMNELGVEVEQLCPNALRGYSLGLPKC